MARRDDPRAAEYFAGWTAYINALAASGIVVSGAGPTKVFQVPTKKLTST